MDVELDLVHLNNPLLPASRSEMALPLKVENRTIGVLDVQSDQPRAFNENDIAIMQTLADHLGVAIERARLIQQVEENLKEIRRVSGETTRDSWKSLAERGVLKNMGYRFDNVRIQPVNAVHDLSVQAMQSGEVIVRQDLGHFVEVAGQSAQFVR